MKLIFCLFLIDCSRNFRREKYEKMAAENSQSAEAGTSRIPAQQNDAMTFSSNEGTRAQLEGEADDEQLVSPYSPTLARFLPSTFLQASFLTRSIKIEKYRI